MGALTKFQWCAFNPETGLNVTVSALLIFLLTRVTGESWMVTGIALLFAWIANPAGSMRDRMYGLAAFATGSVAITLVSGWIGLTLWTNIALLVIAGVLGTLALARGTRAYLVGYAVICWAIYGPHLVAGSSVQNCVLAILLGTAAVAVASVIGTRGQTVPPTDAADDTESSALAKPDYAAVMPYAATVALVLGITTYLGWNLLSTDTLMIVGSAFFVIGFDEHKTWVTGIARALGVAAGMLLGLALAPLVTPGIMTTVVVLGAFFLCFAAEGIHPSAFMFFFTFIVTLGWASLDPAALALNINERLLGEGTGIVIALLAISLLQRIQARQSPPGKPMTH